MNFDQKLNTVRLTSRPYHVVCGQFVPCGTTVGINQYAAYRSPENFKDPYEFVPERWLDDNEFVSDKRAVFQPFSTGARNCLGKK